MIRDQEKYLLERASPEKALWHWSGLFKGLPTKCSDIDLFTMYRGHSIFVEAKPSDAVVPHWQRAHLMAAARPENHWVILVGLSQAMTENLERCWSICWWSWVDKDRWPFDKHRIIGGVAEFQAEISAWKKAIDALEDARETANLCYRQIRVMCRRPWVPQPATGI